MPDPIEQLANTAFTQFGAAIQGSLKLDGAGVEVSRDWNAVLAAKSQLDQLSKQTADGIEAIHANPALGEMERAHMLRQNADLFEAAERAATKNLQASLAKIRASAADAAASDLTVAEPSERPLIRDEIQRHISAATKPKQEAWGGAPFRPGDAPKEALLSLLRQNPARYGGEIASDYGRSLLSAEDHAELRQLAILSTPGSTPKAQSARAVLAAMKATKIEGMPTGLSLVAKTRVETALKPPASDRNAFRRDTIPQPR